MGSFMQDANGVRPADNFLLARQSSIFSLTFDELQNSMGGPDKDFGSMNMEELLKSIWTAEESQTMGSSSAGLGDGSVPSGHFQRQGSLTLPQTLSQKTVDQVWRGVLKETTGAKDQESGTGGANLLSRESTLNEVTLEEFLFRAGVREGIQPSGVYNGLTLADGNNTGLTAGFQQPSVLGNGLSEHNNMVIGLPNIGNNLNGVNLTTSVQSTQPPRSQLQPLFPKQTTIAFSSPNQLGDNAQHCSLERKSPVIMNPLNNNNGQGGAPVSRVSPGNQLHSDAIVSKIDQQSLSPPSCIFAEGRGRRSSASLEKVVERRRRRMIKNRESAARSRARKQAYTLELEAEIEKLKATNQELQKKQEQFIEMQKNENMETKNLPSRGKRVCLRRTLTGPW